MKILTYGSYGGLPPAAVTAYVREYGGSYRADAGLIDYVMSFKNSVTADEAVIAANPRKLWFQRTSEGADGITVHEFLGWSDPADGREGFVTSVHVNEYDESRLKVHIHVYDGAESLEPLPEIVPDPDIPGLYSIKRTQ